ncbi:hypothetical protein NLG97_g8151 [Lecanicillium saksenae]|uniref:Uncharacterized protein n=1 Tax=Lecanicillium saksenae TaxID=468837 RepID=A0ACC1QJU7_9HYPO|nr:hypothetical protein NLG97_g8151 [Lecanicillium saksenae]
MPPPAQSVNNATLAADNFAGRFSDFTSQPGISQSTCHVDVERRHAQRWCGALSLPMDGFGGTASNTLRMDWEMQGRGKSRHGFAAFGARRNYQLQAHQCQSVEVQARRHSARGLLSRLQRGQVSRPSAFGAKLAATVVLDADLRKSWIDDLNVMSGRITAMRKALYEELVRLQTPGDWSHIVSQIGMFSYTGLTAEQVAIMQKESHVYVVSSGRASVAGSTVNK